MQFNTNGALSHLWLRSRSAIFAAHSPPVPPCRYLVYVGPRGVPRVHTSQPVACSPGRRSSWPSVLCWANSPLDTWQRDVGFCRRGLRPAPLPWIRWLLIHVLKGCSPTLTLGYTSWNFSSSKRAIPLAANGGCCNALPYLASSCSAFIAIDERVWADRAMFWLLWLLNLWPTTYNYNMVETKF